MPRTLLQIVNAVQQELGLPQSSAVIGATDFTTIQMLALLNMAGEELRDYPEEGWTSMREEFNLVVNTPLSTTGDVTDGSAVVTNIPGAATLAADAWMCTGSGIPRAARVASVDSPTQVTLTMQATATEAGASLTFSNDTYALPSDFRGYIPDTWWDRTNRWRLMGTDSPQIDQWHRSGIVATGPRRHWRQIGKGSATFRIWPQPYEITDPLQLSFEYLSTDWVDVNGAGASYASAFANDADTPVLDDRALMLSLKYRYWEQKGYNHLPKQQEYLEWTDRLVARDGSAPKLSLVRRTPPFLLTPANIQDGYFPGP